MYKISRLKALSPRFLATIRHKSGSMLPIYRNRRQLVHQRKFDVLQDRFGGRKENTIGLAESVDERIQKLRLFTCK